MTGVGLTYRGKSLVLDPDFQIDWNVEDDILEFDQLGQGFSAQTRIPIKGNESVFKYASNPANARNEFKTIDGFQITMGGNVWWEVSCEVLRVSDDGYYYECVLSTVESRFFEISKKTLKEALTSVTIPIANQTNETNVRSAFNDSKAVVFPNVTFYAKPVYGLIPAFYAKYIAQEIAQSIGYTFIDNYSNISLNKLIIMNNRILDEDTRYSSSSISWNRIDNLIQVSDFMPDITVSEFFNDLIHLVCGKLRLNLADKRIYLDSFQNMQTSKRDSGLEDAPVIIPRQSDVLDIQLAWKSDDLLNIQDDFSGLYIGEFSNAASFEALATVDSYGFCREENAYYKKYSYGTHFYADPFEPSEITSEKFLRKYEFNLTVSRRDKYIYEEITGSYSISDNGSGKVRLNGFTSNGNMPTISQQVRFEESQSPGPSRLYPDIYYQVTAVDGATTSYVDLDVDFEVVSPAGRQLRIGKVTKRTDVGGIYRPVFDKCYHYPEIELNNEKFIGRWLLYHGDLTGGNTFFYASCDSNDANPLTSLDLGNYALRFRFQHNLIEDRWTMLLNFLKETRILKINAKISATKLWNIFEKQPLLKHHKGVMIFKSFRALLTRDGIKNQEVEGYTL